MGGEKMSAKHRDAIRFYLFRQVVSDILLSIPIAIISFMSGDGRIASRYAFVHGVAILGYIAAAILTGMDTLTAPKQKQLIIGIMHGVPSLCSHLCSLIDFTFAYVLGVRVSYCGDDTIQSPSFYRVFVQSRGQYCDAYRSGGSVYTLILAFVLLYCAMTASVFGISMISIDGTSGDFSKYSKLGTLFYGGICVKLFQIAWMFYVGSTIAIVSGVIGLITLGCVIAFAVFYFKNTSTNALNGIKIAIAGLELATITTSIMIWSGGHMPTTMESILPTLVFFPSAVYICIAIFTLRPPPNASSSLAVSKQFEGSISRSPGASAFGSQSDIQTPAPTLTGATLNNRRSQTKAAVRI